VSDPRARVQHYISISSPHLGSRRPGGNVINHTFKFGASVYLNNFNGLTGQELLLEDGKDEELPLLLRMTRLGTCHRHGAIDD